MTESIELCEEELDIIGDCDENEETSDVIIYCKGTRTCLCVFTLLSEMFFPCIFLMLRFATYRLQM